MKLTLCAWTGAPPPRSLAQLAKACGKPPWCMRCSIRRTVHAIRKSVAGRDCLHAGENVHAYKQAVLALGT